MKIGSYDGAAHNDVMIGEGVDWNIPTDFPEDTVNMTATNTGGSDGPSDLVYCQGIEA